MSFGPRKGGLTSALVAVVILLGVGVVTLTNRGANQETTVQSPQSPDPQVPLGWRMHTDRENGFSIAIPPKYREAELPQSEMVIDPVLFAYDVDSGHILLVAKFPYGGLPPIAEMSSAEIEDLKGYVERGILKEIQGTFVRAASVSSSHTFSLLPAGRALVISATVRDRAGHTMMDPTAGVPLKIQAFYLNNGGVPYSIEVTDETIAPQLVSSFRFTDADPAPTPSP